MSFEQELFQLLMILIFNKKIDVLIMQNNKIDISSSVLYKKHKISIKNNKNYLDLIFAIASTNA